MNGMLEASTAIYVALAVALAVWIGIFVYLWRIDAQARELRRQIERLPEEGAPTVPTAILRRAEIKEQRTEREAVEH